MPLLQKEKKKSCWVVHIFHLSTQKKETAYLYEFKTSLFYVGSSRPIKSVERDLVSK